MADSKYGYYEIIKWDLTDVLQSPSSNRVYFVQLKVDSETTTSKIGMIK
ncbi:MAG: hypothetical protein ACUVTF_08145 [bacterium]